MINLAGITDADRHIEEELFLAGITTDTESTDGEVPYTIIGRLNGWVFRRAWYYYMVSCLGHLGLPYNQAVELHERKYPFKDERYSILGEAVRTRGHAGAQHPNEYLYPTMESIEEEFVKARLKFPKIDFDTERAFDRSWTRIVQDIKYMRLYHIDTLVGLKEFADTIRRLSID